MLPGLIPAYMRHLPEITGASNDRSHMFCGHLAGFAVFGSIDPIENGWLDEFLTRSAHREHMHCVGSVTQVLREADDQAKESAWDRWIERYLRRRVQANPIPLDSEESGAMCEWPLILHSHYAEIVELLLTGPAPEVKGDMFYYRLHEAALLDRAPALTARFLTALLSQEDGHNLWGPRPGSHDGFAADRSRFNGTCPASALRAAGKVGVTARIGISGYAPVMTANIRTVF
jgi:hypothetical protein